MRLGRPDIAASDSEYALQLDPGHVRSLMRSAAAALALGDVRAAADRYRAALRAEPNLIKAQAHSPLKKTNPIETLSIPASSEAADSGRYCSCAKTHMFKVVCMAWYQTYAVSFFAKIIAIMFSSEAGCLNEIAAKYAAKYADK